MSKKRKAKAKTTPTRLIPINLDWPLEFEFPTEEFSETLLNKLKERKFLLESDYRAITDALFNKMLKLGW